MLEQILQNYPPTEDSVLEILLAVQATNQQNYVTERQIKAIAAYCKTSESKVSSVVSFYTLISDVPRGKHIIQLCSSVPCYISGGPLLLKTMEKLLEIHVGETSENGMFTLEFTSCLGCCDKGPVVRIDQKTYKNCTVEKIKAIISEYGGKGHA
jgi:NADH-quinone oxidoreductase subunit E